MWQEPSPSLNPKCVVDSFSEYTLNTCGTGLAAEYTTEQHRHICSSQGVQSLCMVNNKYQSIITLLNTHCNFEKTLAYRSHNRKDFSEVVVVGYPHDG